MSKNALNTLRSEQKSCVQNILVEMNSRRLYNDLKDFIQNYDDRREL